LIWAVGLAKTVGFRAILVKVGEMAAEEIPAGILQIQGVIRIAKTPRRGTQPAQPQQATMVGGKTSNRVHFKSEQSPTNLSFEYFARQ